MKAKLLAMILLFLPIIAFSQDYYATVSRTESNKYEIKNWASDTNTQWYANTWLCLELAYYDDAIISYSPGRNNKITFRNGKTCTLNTITYVYTYR